LTTVIPVGALVYVAVIALSKRDSLHRLVLFIASGIRDGATPPGKEQVDAPRVATRRSREPPPAARHQPGMNNDLMAS
jgi:hypothetical protein